MAMIGTSLQNCNQILVSASKSTKLSGAYHRHFYSVPLKNLDQLAELMLAKAWSPITWKDGLRLSQNFTSAQFIALDFDDGRLTLSRAKELLDEMGVSYILGTSKSHQKEKRSASGVVTPPCDRFRLVMMAKCAVTTKDTYEYNMRLSMDVWPCDPSCKDAARFFYPCRDIVSVKRGTKIEICEVPEELNRESLIARQRERDKRHIENDTLPAWIEAALAHGCDEGGRHTLCYRIGANLWRLGYTEEKIVGLIMQGPLKNIGKADVERAVCNGAERARNET